MGTPIAEFGAQHDVWGLSLLSEQCIVYAIHALLLTPLEDDGVHIPLVAVPRVLFDWAE